MIRGTALLLLSLGLFPASVAGPPFFAVMTVAALLVAGSWAARTD